MNIFWTSTLVNVAPFVLLFLLWFLMSKKGKNSSQNAVAGQQEILTELQALRQSIEALRKDLNDRR